MLAGTTRWTDAISFLKLLGVAPAFTLQILVNTLIRTGRSWDQYPETPYVITLKRYLLYETHVAYCVEMVEVSGTFSSFLTELETEVFVCKCLMKVTLHSHLYKQGAVVMWKWVFALFLQDWMTMICMYKTICILLDLLNMKQRLLFLRQVVTEKICHNQLLDSWVKLEWLKCK